MCNGAIGFQDRARMRNVDLNFLLVGLLLGGSIGAVFCVQRLAPKAVILTWLGAGWLLCFAWHLWLVASVRQGVAEGLQRSAGMAQAPILETAGSVTMNTLSGLY